MTSSESNYSNIVEVNGVNFQTEIQSVISTLPAPWAETPIRLGIHVTNKTSKCFYFERLDALVPLPTLIDDSGNLIEIDSDLLRLRVKGKPYYLVEPGKSHFLSLDSFICQKIFTSQLKIYNEAGGFFYFKNIKPREYKLQLSYTGNGQKPMLPLEARNSVTSWIGEAIIPFVNFRIIG